jgi:hypothetical protein
MSLTSVDLPEPDTPVTATKQPERELDVDVLEVVLAGARRRASSRPFVRRAAHGGHRDRRACRRGTGR